MCASPIQVAVNQSVVGFAPVLQAGVDPLHQEIHHPPVGGVTDEQHLGRKVTNNIICKFQKAKDLNLQFLI